MRRAHYTTTTKIRIGLVNMSRLADLCAVHNQQGGTIHQFNDIYKTDILNLTDSEFNQLIKGHKTMKTTIQRKDLLKLLSNAKSTVEVRSTMPVLQNVHLTISPRSLELQSTDLELALIQRAQCLNSDTFESFKVCLPYRQLCDVVKASSEQIELLQGSDCGLLINGVLVRGCESAMWPLMPTVSGESFTMDFKDVERVIFATSTDVTRYHLNGVFIDKSCMVAMDGHRLARVEHKSTLPSNAGYVLPTKGLKLLSKLFDGPVNCIDSQYMKFSQGLGLCELYVRKIEGKYPNYNQFIPQKFTHAVTLKRVELIGHLKSLLPLAPKHNGAGHLEFAKDMLTICNGPRIEYDKTDKKNHVEISRSPVIVKVMKSDYSLTDNFKIGFNMNYLIDALESLNSETAVFNINDKLSPADIKSNGSTQNNIVMPMRI